MFRYVWWRVEGVTKCDRMERSVSVSLAETARPLQILLGVPQSWRKHTPSLWAEGGHLSHESFMTCLRGRSGSPFCTCWFSSAVGLKYSACQGAYFGVDYPESLHYKHLEKILAISCWGKNSPSLNLGIPFFSPRDKGSHWGKHKVCLYCKFKIYYGEVPGGPVTKTPSSQCRWPRFDSWSGNKILHATT